jgi:proteasome lid subunit RPN8/RPN11
MSEHSTTHNQVSARRVTISRQAEQALIRDVWQRSAIEACGVLLGHIDGTGGWHISDIRPLRNIYDSPVYFEFAPEDLLEAELAHPGEIIGAYHSHPTGLRRASTTDRDNMQRVNVEQQIPWVWFIVSGPFPLEQAQQQRQLEVVAYHHYADMGLRTLPVEFASGE